MQFDSGSSPEGEIVSRDRLLREANDALYTLFSARRRLVAFTGSGLSLIYGGLTWHEAIMAIVEDTLAEIEEKLTASQTPLPENMAVRAPRISSAAVQVLRRHQRMIEAYAPRWMGGHADHPAPALTHQDRMVVLEICEDARTTVRQHAARLGLRAPLSAKAFFARLVENDDIATSLRLVERLNGYAAQSKPPLERRRLRDAAIMTLIGSDADAHPRDLGDRKGRYRQCAAKAEQFYTLSTLRALGKVLPSLRDVVEDVATLLRQEMDAAGHNALETLPIDRRSTLAPFVAMLTDAERGALQADLAARHSEETPRPPPRPLTDPLRRLTDPMMIERFMTLNYDWELERLVMYPDRFAEAGRTYDIRRALSEGLVRSETATVGGPLTRRMPDGRYVTSEVYAVQASARLFEFALNSPDHAAYILHLHGRADAPEGIVAREPDYHRTYRRETSNPRALERALDVALTGNPILFVGTGLSEAEITRAFRQLVSQGRVTPDRPAFALMPHRGGEETSAWREHAAHFQVYGIHVLHYGHPRRGPDQNLPVHKALIDSLIERTRRLRQSGEPASEGPAFDPSRYGILAAMPADQRMVAWIADILKPKARAAKAALFASMSPGSGARARRLDTALRGIEDYLQRLEQRLASQALAMELDFLAHDIARHVRAGEQLPRRREATRWSATDGDPAHILWSRHFNASGDDPHRADAPTPSPLLTEDHTPISAEALFTDAPVTLIIGPPHAGKGTLVRHLFGANANRPEGDLATLIVNLTFVVEVDGAIALIYQFLADHGLVDRDNPLNRLNKIAALLRAPTTSLAGSPTRKCRLVLMGLERVLDQKGACISPDMDFLLQLLVHTPPEAPVCVVLVATPALDRWVAREAQGAQTRRLAIEPPTWTDAGIARAFDAILDDICARSSPAFAKRLEYRRLVAARQTSTEQKVRATLEILLDYWRDYLVLVDRLPVDQIDRALALDFAVLRFLSLVTAPVEPQTLQHVPRIRELRHLNGGDQWPCASDVQASLERLAHARLSVRLPPAFAPDPQRAPDHHETARYRYALHRVVLREMRDRLGVQVGDALLSNTFSITLAASLPVDVSVPDEDVRGEIERVLSSLRGAWKDADLARPDDDDAAALTSLRGLIDGAGRNPHAADLWRAMEAFAILQRRLAMNKVDMHAALRSSCNLIRSFFSATTLVMMSPGEVDPAGHPLTPFDQHKKRIRKIFETLTDLEATEDTRVPEVSDPHGRAWLDAALDAVQAAAPAGPDAATAETCTGRLRDAFEKAAVQRPAPLYGGEIVWLHNERGVISLIQGDLYEATYSFDRALQANTHYKGDGRGNNRNRIDLNRSMLMIERGRLAEARTLLHDLLHDVQGRVRRERLMLSPIAEGYLGLVAHLNGRSDDALAHYNKSVTGLIETEQLRALSLFQMRRASLLGSTRQPAGALDDINAAIRSAEACRQIDVLWRARILRATLDPDSRDREHIAREAFIAAERLGLIRVAVEALMARAESAMATNSLEHAADLIAQAMSRATRSGMTLRRIALRVSMGRIMLRQGDENGAWLVQRAIAHADRIGYQSCVQKANEVLLRNGMRRP